MKNGNCITFSVQKYDINYESEKGHLNEEGGMIKQTGLENVLHDEFRVEQQDTFTMASEKHVS